MSFFTSNKTSTSKAILPSKPPCRQAVLRRPDPEKISRKHGSSAVHGTRCERGSLQSVFLLGQLVVAAQV